MLTVAQARAREFKTTASQAPLIMSGDNAALIKLWRERIGEAEPDDLANVWPVQLGSYLESFILDWHERKTGMELTERGTFHPHPRLESIGATLDCYRAHDDTVIDAKVTGQWMRLDDVVAYYTPQIIVQMRCRNAMNGALLIVHGSAEPQEIAITPSPDYEAVLWERMVAFEMCVRLMTPPAPLARIVPPEQWRSIDLDSIPKPWPNWATDLAIDLNSWREMRPSALAFEEKAAAIKALLPDDVGRLDYAGMQIKRNRRGAITIKDMQE